MGSWHCIFFSEWVSASCQTRWQKAVGEGGVGELLQTYFLCCSLTIKRQLFHVTKATAYRYSISLSKSLFRSSRKSMGGSVTALNQSNHSSQSQKTETIQWTNQNSKKIHPADAKRGKTRASKSQFLVREGSPSSHAREKRRTKWSSGKESGEEARTCAPAWPCLQAQIMAAAYFTTIPLEPNEESQIFYNICPCAKGIVWRF